MPETQIAIHHTVNGRTLISQGSFTETMEKAKAHIPILEGLGQTNVYIVTRYVSDWEPVDKTSS